MCTSHDLKVFEVKRAHIEMFARSLEQDGKARANGRSVCDHDPGSHRFVGP